MNGKSLKYFVMGAAIVAAGLGALAIDLPAAFAPGEPLSAAKFNDYFTRIKTAIDALEAPNSVTTARLQDNAVTGAKIANGAVATAKIADGAVNAAKTLDEAGVRAVDLSDATATIVATSLGSVTLNAPAPGAVIVTATFSARALHINSIRTIGVFALATSSGTVDGANVSLASVSIPASFPSSANSTDFYITPVTIRRTFFVSAGNNTFFLNGQTFTPTPITAVFGNLSAVYVPTQY